MKKKIVTNVEGECPQGHPLVVWDSGEFLFGDCKSCDDTWRVMFDGKVIPHAHPLG